MDILGTCECKLQSKSKNLLMENSHWRNPHIEKVATKGIGSEIFEGCKAIAVESMPNLFWDCPCLFIAIQKCEIKLVGCGKSRFIKCNWLVQARGG